MRHSSLRVLRFGVILIGSYVIFCSGVLFGQDKPVGAITYRLSMSRPVSHLFEVSIEVQLPDGGAVETLDFQMAKWSPGRYAVFDFAKNVQEFQAAAGICPPKSLCDLSSRPVLRVNDQTWRVSTLGSDKLTISYKVFGNDLSGTFSQLDIRHANYNGGSVFMYIVDHKADPVRLVIDPPPGWRIVNGQMETPEQREWSFPNWDVMIDTPTEIAANWTQEDFQVDGKNYHVVVHSFGDEGDKRPALVKDIERIVRAETTLWGPPEFDSYTFLIHFAADDVSGDGMEHLTSTQIIEPGALVDSGVYDETLGTVAHEFFHVWNVKRLRPLELGPWDFTRPANTRGLWIAEGFTNYYGHLLLRRSGIWTDSQFLRRESNTITQIESAPGTRLMSAEESSLVAPFIDDAPHAQRTDLDNTAISYYPKGELIGMVLDLVIRGRSNGKASLDDVMRQMYEEFYLKSPNSSYYLRGRGYTTDDFRRVASETGGLDLSDFFARNVRGVETLPYDEAFGFVGLRLVREVAREPYDAGISLDFGHAEGAVIGDVRHGSVAENAGLQQGDVILTVAGVGITQNDWLKRLNRYKQGSRISIVVKRDRQSVRATIVLGPPERFEYRIVERTDATVVQKELRRAWLSGAKS